MKRHHLTLPMQAVRVVRKSGLACEVRTGTGNFVAEFEIERGISNEQMVQQAHAALHEMRHQYAGNVIRAKTLDDLWR